MKKQSVKEFAASIIVRINALPEAIANQFALTEAASKIQDKLDNGKKINRAQLEKLEQLSLNEAELANEPDDLSQADEGEAPEVFIHKSDEPKKAPKALTVKEIANDFRPEWSKLADNGNLVIMIHEDSVKTVTIHTDDSDEFLTGGKPVLPLNIQSGGAYDLGLFFVHFDTFPRSWKVSKGKIEATILKNKASLKKSKNGYDAEDVFSFLVNSPLNPIFKEDNEL